MSYLSADFSSQVIENLPLLKASLWREGFLSHLVLLEDCFLDSKGSGVQTKPLSASIDLFISSAQYNFDATVI